VSYFTPKTELSLTPKIPENPEWVVGTIEDQKKTTLIIIIWRSRRSKMVKI
jgi:hypothetical protein